MSELHRRSIEVFVKILQNQGLAKTFPTTAQAKNFLEEIGLFQTLSPKNRVSLITKMQEEELIMQGIDPSYIKKKTTTTISPDQFQKAEEILGKKISVRDEGPILGPVLGEEDSDDAEAKILEVKAKKDD
jgi:hypothetical protein